MSRTEGKLPQNSSKRVLIVSYYWPPSGGGGVQRWLKFAKLLPAKGWEPVVVTPSNPDVPVTDPSLLEEVSEQLEVWSFPVWEPTRMLQRLGLAGGTSRLGAERPASRSFLSSVVSWVRGNLFLPDARVGWVRPTTRKVLRQLKETPVDVVVTTGPPHSMHLIGLALQRATGLPWIADFRDPWSTMDYLDDFGLTASSHRRLEAMEREVIQTADRVLVTSPGALRELGVDSSKGVVIPNGWDRDDFPDTLPEPSAHGAPVLGHFGALYGSRNPTALWPALAEIGWKLLLAGPVTEDVLRDIHEAGVDVTHLGDLPHRESVARMHECHGLLVTHNDSRSARSSTPGKVFECLATGRPVLAFGPRESDLQQRCLDEGVSFIAHGHKEEGDMVRTWLKEHQAPRASSPHKGAAKLERRALTAELGAVLNSVLPQ